MTGLQHCLFELRARVLHPRVWASWYWRMFTTYIWCSGCRETIVGYCWKHAPVWDDVSKALDRYEKSP